jgi:hypothetical protein
MASRKGKAAKTAGAVGGAATAVKSSPYVQRLVEDEELRDAIREAFEAARDAYARMSNGKGPAKALMDDKKVHKDLQQAAENLKEASDRIRGKKQRKGLTLGRLLMFGLIGAILVLVLSEEARKAVMDKLFGAEEEFEYTSTTTSSSTPQTAAEPTTNAS